MGKEHADREPEKNLADIVSVEFHDSKPPGPAGKPQRPEDEDDKSAQRNAGQRSEKKQE